MGKNSSGFNSSNDFLEADALLNMTSFNDSISNLYAINQTPKQTTSIFIFKRNITGIPIANSFNNSNFTTGILWDTSDDTNGEYDSAEAEDLVFISQTKLDSKGSFGTYDYEMRFPSNLKLYHGPNSRLVYIS